MEHRLGHGEVKAGAAGENPAAPEAVVRAHRPAVLRLLTRLTHDASLAEDLTQETFVTALQHADSWRGEGTLRGWLMSIARSRWLMSKRAPAARHQPVDEVSLETLGLQAGWGSPLDPEVLTAQLEQRERLEQALAALDDEAREVLTLRELEELSGEETAQALGLSLAAMKSRLHRARLALVAQVKKGASHA
ncbi:MAG: RNA polymerase sigma factor [Archangium sp.]|nr:RNA polymerase sigma factor [Archangium sp.]